MGRGEPVAAHLPMTANRHPLLVLLLVLLLLLLLLLASRQRLVTPPECRQRLPRHASPVWRHR